MKLSISVVFITLALFLFPFVAGAEKELRSVYDSGFILETAQRDFRLKIGGGLHADVRSFQSDHRGAPLSFDIRRARFDLTGTIRTWFVYRLQAELAGKPYIRNAWLDVGPWRWFHLRVGQMKVPFSTSWLTLDNNVNFVERAASTPVYPFFDRGLLLWGDIAEGLLTYNFGVYTGAGIDIDAPSGDIDDSKDVAARLFVQPFRNCPAEPLSGIYVVGQATWGRMSVPTSRFETGGLRSANFETAVWRWRTEQTLGTDGRVTDKVSAEVESRFRWGAELHYLLGPFSLSSEYLENHYEDISVYHDLLEGSAVRVHQPLFQKSGTIRSLSIWASVYVTGERKRISNFGWETAKPKQNLGEGGYGAWEVLARYSQTRSSKRLFASRAVAGFDEQSPLLPAGYDATLPGAGKEMTVTILDGARLVNEFTVGLCWTLNPHVRIQLDDVFLFAPSVDGNGERDGNNKLVSGANSEQGDPGKKNQKTAWENAVMARLIFKL